MFVADIKRVVEQVSRDKGIDRQVLIEALEEALKSAARKKYGSKIDIEVQYNEGTGEIEVFQFKEVVEAIDDPLQVADPVAVGVAKAAWIDLVDHRAAPPLLAVTHPQNSCKME